VLFIVVGVLFVAALIFAIFSFTGRTVLQSGGNVGQPLVDEAGNVDARCGTSDQSYQDFIDALNKVRNR